MKMRAFVTAVSFAAFGMAMTPVHAQGVDPCTVYLCMAGISGFGASGGPACAPAITYWHTPSPAGLAVWGTYVFLPPASYARRLSYMTVGCPAANAATNAAVLQAIMTEWGSVP